MAQIKRIPVYLVLDVSGSMDDTIGSVKDGVNLCLQNLKEDPRTKETACVGIITFESEVKEILPLTRLQDIADCPPLTTGGGTAFGSALLKAVECAQTEVVKKTPDTPGDKKPMVFVMTDGEPTEDDAFVEQAIQDFNAYHWATVIPCAVSGASDRFLKKLGNAKGEIGIRLDNPSPDAFKKLFKIVSQSIASGNFAAIAEAAKQDSSFSML